jgi:2-polyprenyl-3-methyl-5-hydroxy-6-metoxy-1,4-benzoquinol methylase
MKTTSGGSSLYVGYAEWKGWDAPFFYDADKSDYYARECAELAIGNADVLEIGFGSGSFLAWARDQGARVSGTEIIPEMVGAAIEFGVEVLSSDLEHIADGNRSRFDTIVAFDVFEHFSLPEIVVRLQCVASMLKPGGHLLLRFPNGQSPFGLASQYGDPTHKTALSLGVIGPLIQRSSWSVVRYEGMARAAGIGLAKRIVRLLRRTIQDLIAAMLNLVYAQDIPWDPVVVLVLRKHEEKDRRTQ